MQKKYDFNDASCYREYLSNLLGESLMMRPSIKHSVSERIQTLAISWGRSETDAAYDARCVLNLKSAINIYLEKSAEAMLSNSNKK